MHLGCSIAALLLLLMRSVLSRNTLAGTKRILTQEQSRSLLSRLQEANHCKDVKVNDRIPFVIDGTTFGSVQHEFAKRLSEDSVFVLGPGNELHLASDLESASVESRSDAVAQVLQRLNKEGIVTGWRDEQLPLVKSFNEEAVMLIERAAIPFFGAKAYGVHVNGYVRRKDNHKDDSTKPTHLWVGKRAISKSTYPGMLDHIVAGGLSHGLQPLECVIKECWEEAGIPPELASTATAAGAVSYCSADDLGQLRNDVLFCYDLDLSDSGFTPNPVDGEVESFSLQSIDLVIENLFKGNFKPNVNIVIIDFLVRHGIISFESTPDYLQLVDMLRTVPLR